MPKLFILNKKIRNHFILFLKIKTLQENSLNCINLIDVMNECNEKKTRQKYLYHLRRVLNSTSVGYTISRASETETLIDYAIPVVVIDYQNYNKFYNFYRYSILNSLGFTLSSFTIVFFTRIGFSIYHSFRLFAQALYFEQK